MKALKSKKKLAILVKGRKKSKALYTAAKNVKLDKKSKLDGVHLYSFTDIGSKEEVGDDATIRTNINTSSETSSSRALSDQVYDIEFREILQIGSADSYFSTSLSSISLDGRDDSHSKPLQNSDSAEMMTMTMTMTMTMAMAMMMAMMMVIVETPRNLTSTLISALMVGVSHPNHQLLLQHSLLL